MTIPHARQDCPICHGTGRVPRDAGDPLAKFGPATCPKCGGSGSVAIVLPRPIPPSGVGFDAGRYC